MLFKAPIYLFIGLCAATTLLSSCESQSQKPPATTTAPAATAEAAPTAAATYECPMQCAGSQSDKPGKCPVCKMDLEKKS